MRQWCRIQARSLKPSSNRLLRENYVASMFARVVPCPISPLLALLPRNASTPPLQLHSTTPRWRARRCAYVKEQRVSTNKPLEIISLVISSDKHLLSRSKKPHIHMYP